MSYSSKINKSNLLLHIFGCISFMILPFVFFPHPQNIASSFHNPATIRDFLGQGLLTGFFYLTYYLLIPKYYYPKKYLLFVLFVVASFLVIVCLPSVITGRFSDLISTSQQAPPNLGEGNSLPPPFPSHNTNRNNLPQQKNTNSPSSLFEEISHHIFLFFVVLFFSLMLGINNRWKQSQKEKMDAELSYLKAQINPHFLFNTLNSIYSLTILKSDVAPEAIIKLAGMMRYILHEATKERVSLIKELEYIQDYIELQKLRFGNQIPIEFAVTGKVENRYLVPLVLIVFVENAFKHGVNAEENSHISVDIDVTGNNLVLKVTNNKVSNSDEEKSGIGLQNVQNRLRLLYPEKHQLKIEDTKDYFSVLLHIWLI